MTAFREVERTVEFEPIDGWVYRITEFDDGAVVKRAAASERPVWSRGSWFKSTSLQPKSL